MTRRRCYYEVLSVEPTATDDELKRAYRKSALRLHPDKNIDRAEEAAEQFKEVQHAYSVLGDPDERAWYDSHKEAILTGRDDGGAGNAPDEVNLWDYFSPSAYGPVDGDEPNSFCSIYRELFDTVAREERQYADVKAPTFGDSTAPYATVQAFYAFWGSYSTRKSFAWKDEYKAASMPDRFQRRAAERINQKERDSARREYSKTLQDLVAFVKKRDPRVLAENKRLEEVAEQREAEQAERKAEAMEKVAARNKEWAKEAQVAEAKAAAEAAAAGDEHFAMKQDGTFFDAVYEAQARAEIERQQRELEEEMGQVEDPEQRLYKCAPCKKTLKGERLWTEHLKSNKHKAADKKWRQKNPELAAQADKEQAEEAATRKAAAEAAPAQPATPSPAPAAAPVAAAASPTGASEPAEEGSDSESSEEEYVSAKKAKQQKKKAAAAAAAAPKHRDPAAEDSDEEGGRRRKDKGKKGKKKVAYDDEEEEPKVAKGGDLAAQLSEMQLSKKEAAAMAKMVADKAKGKKGNLGPQKASPVPADDSEDDTPSTMKKGKKGKGKK